jgi:hypothetical protein
MNSPLPPPKVDPRPDGYMGAGASFEKLVDSRMFITFARVLMICASVIGLPVAGWMMTRMIDRADKIVEKVDGSHQQLQLLDQSVKFGFDRQKADLDRLQIQVIDHDGRIRVIERDIRNVTSNSNQLPSRPN